MSSGLKNLELLHVCSRAGVLPGRCRPLLLWRPSWFFHWLWFNAAQIKVDWLKEQNFCQSLIESSSDRCPTTRCHTCIHEWSIYATVPMSVSDTMAAPYLQPLPHGCTASGLSQLAAHAFLPPWMSSNYGAHQHDAYSPRIIHWPNASWPIKYTHGPRCHNSLATETASGCSETWWCCEDVGQG